jgi:hypothetical protein
VASLGTEKPAPPAQPMIQRPTYAG